ncbi:hypothetical protein NGF19_03915 [Streptomyces sp. RY43-2]|uniref:Uncharacterized protein n=1 Tax=Streptomyces macrolidinus TaxID=2952607 RepID=A0ABT0ZAU8_9ACTN|nr:hypothetical protein [Streptomyces macrolidinus]MCN9239941.1 hypothetical protein [Streptomyces macrolidinus]
MEYQHGALISLITYESGVENGPVREWCMNGTLQSEGVMLWANELGGTRKWPCFDIAERIAPSVQVSPELSTKLETYIEHNIGGISTEDVCRFALRWATLRDTHLKLPDLEDPFEPLITLYERGGEVIADETRTFNFSNQSLRVMTWQEHLSSKPCTSLDPAGLDALDA